MYTFIGVIGYLFFAAIAYCILFLLIKSAVKNGVKEALLDLRLLDKDALRTIDAENRPGGGSNTGSYT